MLQHHFDSLEQQQEASAFGMWVFFVTEVLFFGGMFFAYMIYRMWYPEAWVEASSHLDIPLGALNTAVLIGSSLTMAFAVRSAQLGEQKGQVLFLILTLVLGLTFLGVKVVQVFVVEGTVGDEIALAASIERVKRDIEAAVGAASEVAA